MRCEQCGRQQDEGRWCGRCGSLLPAKVTSEGDAVRDEGAADEGVADGGAANAGVPREGEAAATSWSPRGVAAGLLAALVAVAVGWQWLSDGAELATPAPTGKPEEAAPEPTGKPEQASPAPTGRAEELPPKPVTHDQLPFDEPTGTALIFDAAGEGAVVLDVDTGSTARFRLPRGDAAEQPYPLLRRGEWLVVAQHGGWALAPGGGSEVTARSLGDGQFAMAAAEPEQVWLVDEGDGRGEATWTLVEVTGAVVAQVRVDEGYTPIRGVPAGLAVRDEEGAVLVYDVGADGFRPFLEEGARVLDATADRVITCSEPCEELAVRDERGEVIDRLGTEGVRGHGAGWLSPDGRHLAVWASVYVDGPAGGVAVSVEIRIYDVDEGELLDRGPATLGGFAGSWTPDSEQFFYRTVTVGPPTPLGRYAVGEGFEVAPLDVQDVPLGDLVALSRESLGPLLADNGDDDR